MKFSPRFFLFAALAALLVVGLAAIGCTLGAKVAVVAYLAGNALCTPLASYSLGASAITKLADLWIPEIVSQGMEEPLVEKTAFIDSGVVVSSADVVAAASGPGTDIKINSLIVPNHDDQQQQEDTAPELRKIVAGPQQRVAIMNRVSPLAGTALSGVISGVKPNGDILQILLNAVQSLRKRQRNRTVIAQLKGLFGISAAPDAATGAWKDLRLDHFSETTNTDDDKLIDNDMLIDTVAKLGENADSLQGAAALMHSKLMFALNKQDQIDVIRNSEGKIILGAWKDMAIFPSDLLVRAGTTSGSVYFTFLCGRGSIMMADKPQVVTDLAGEVAALQLDVRDIAKNNVAVYDRTRFICHPQGANWNPGEGVPAISEAGPSNVELAAAANWSSSLNDIRNARMVCLRTNG